MIRNSEIGRRCPHPSGLHSRGSPHRPQRASLGPYSHLRPGSDIGEGAHVGNFVETKKIKLGKGSKANHLTYLGDAEIGAGVNIGAGTITCNYDGVHKHTTVIERRRFHRQRQHSGRARARGQGRLRGRSLLHHRATSPKTLSPSAAPDRS